MAERKGTRDKGTGSKSDSAHVALLRGVNVGGKNTLPMKDLLAMFRDAGCRDAHSYIQSGNVTFRASSKVARRVPSLIASAAEDRFGFRVPVLVRTADELRRVTDGNPFVRARVDVGALHVAFLADHPGAAQVAALDPSRSAPDEFAALGREIYLHCPNGFARTKLTNQYFDAKLGTTSTVRNWKTVLKLLQLAGG